MGNSQLLGALLCSSMAHLSAPASQGMQRVYGGMRLSGIGWGLHGPGCSHLQNVEQESERRGKQVGRHVGAEMSPLQAAPVILQDMPLRLVSQEEEGKDPEDMSSFLYQLVKAVIASLPVLDN